MSDSVYSAGGVCSSIEAWNTTAVDIEELSSVVDGDLRILLLMLSSLLMLLARLVYARLF